MFRKYDDDTMRKFVSAIRGNKGDFSDLLQKYSTLAALANAFNGDEEAEMWLRVRGGENVYTFYKTMEGDEQAQDILSKLDDKFLICFALACKNKVEGKIFLVKMGYERFVAISEEIYNALDYIDKQNSFWYRIFH
jgi:hypothetical protein